MKSYPWDAGVWEQEREFVRWSSHLTEAAAQAAARKYARQQSAPTGGRLSWAGGARCVATGDVRWYRGDGSQVEP